MTATIGTNTVRYWLYFAGVMALLLLLSVVSLFWGAVHIDLRTMDGETLFILTQSRIPRLIAIWITGAGMAIAGLIMQQLSQNKFASPSTSGTIESASLGILMGMIFFPEAGTMTKIVISFAFALAGSWLFMMMLRRIVFKDALFIPLLGIMFGRVIAAMTTFFAYKYDLVQSINAYLFGDFSGVLKGRYELLYVGIICMIVAYIYAKKFTIAGLGESFAESLGLQYKTIRRIGLIIVAIITATIVLTVGEVPFIGLVVPNMVTMILGDNVERNMPFVAVGGAIFVLAADILGRMILYPFEVSVSLVIGLLGGISFLLFIGRRRAV